MAYFAMTSLDWTWEPLDTLQYGRNLSKDMEQPLNTLHYGENITRKDREQMSQVDSEGWSWKQSSNKNGTKWKVDKKEIIKDENKTFDVVEKDDEKRKAENNKSDEKSTLELLPQNNLNYMVGDFSNDDSNRKSKKTKCSEKNFRKDKVEDKVEHTEKKCEYCELTFASTLKKKLHKERYRDSDQNFICPQADCREKFSGKLLTGAKRLYSVALKNHMNKHCGKNVVCTECGKLFFSNEYLYGHMRESHKTRKIKCEQCSQVFKSNDGLRRHILLHDTRRKFSCSLCNLRYEEISSRNRHMKMYHNDTNPMLNCKLCEKKFKTEQGIKSHTRQVHDRERNHGCADCSYKFINRSKLNRHIRRVHLKFNSNDPPRLS